jgi:chromosome segregation ATPase
MLPITAIEVGAKVLGGAKRFWYLVPITGLLALSHCRGEKIDDLQGDLTDAGNALAVAASQAKTLEDELQDISDRIKADNTKALEEEAKRTELAKNIAADRARLDERFSNTKRTVAALEASAAQVPADECAPSAAALKALEDL